MQLEPSGISGLFHVLFKKKSDHLFIEFFRYFFVAVAAIATDFAILFVLTHFINVYYLISSVISYLAGMCVNYLISVVWVFNKRKYGKQKKEIIIFFVIGILGLFVNGFLMWLFTEIFAFYYLISRIFSAGVGYIWKYVARKLILFR